MMPEQHYFAIRPLQYNDMVIIEDRTIWGQPRVNMSPHHKGIGAIAEDGRLVGYCGFYNKPRGSEATIGAIQSRMSGAGTALLNALKARFYYLIAEDVLTSAVEWWEQRGFVLSVPAAEDDEEGIVGTYEWWRDDDLVFREVPYELAWPSHRCVSQLIWDEQKRQHATRTSNFPGRTS